MSDELTERRIVITRAAHQYDELAELVRVEGGEPLNYPAIAIVPSPDTTALDDALRSGAFDWIVMTSANTAFALAERLSAISATLPVAQIAVVGRGTAAAVATYLQRTPNVIPNVQDLQALFDTLHLKRGARVFIPQSELADRSLVEALIGRGVHVTSVEAYRVVTANGGVDLPRLIPDAPERYTVTFTSGSTVDHFVRRYTQEGGSLDDLENVAIAVMGASAERALTTHGFTAAIRARENTLNALVQALKETIHAG